MKKLYIGISVLVLCACIGVGIWYYYHNYVETVTEYILVKYTPPIEHDGYTSKEHSEMAFVSYSDDSTAVKRERVLMADYHNGVLDEYLKMPDTPPSDDQTAVMTWQAKRNAFEELLAEERILIRLTHVRSLEPKELLQLIKKHGMLSEPVDMFIQDNKIDAAFYPIK